jgi:hypothetical protein
MVTAFDDRDVRTHPGDRLGHFDADGAAAEDQ